MSSSASSFTPSLFPAGPLVLMAGSTLEPLQSLSVSELNELIKTVRQQRTRGKLAVGDTAAEVLEKVVDVKIGTEKRGPKTRIHRMHTNLPLNYQPSATPLFLTAKLAAVAPTGLESILARRVASDPYRKLPKPADPHTAAKQRAEQWATQARDEASARRRPAKVVPRGLEAVLAHRVALDPYRKLPKPTDPRVAAKERAAQWAKQAQEESERSGQDVCEGSGRTASSFVVPTGASTVAPLQALSVPELHGLIKSARKQRTCGALPVGDVAANVLECFVDSKRAADKRVPALRVHRMHTNLPLNYEPSATPLFLSAKLAAVSPRGLVSILTSRIAADPYRKLPKPTDPRVAATERAALWAKQAKEHAEELALQLLRKRAAPLTLAVAEAAASKARARDSVLDVDTAKGAKAPLPVAPVATATPSKENRCAARGQARRALATAWAALNEAQAAFNALASDSDAENEDGVWVVVEDC